MSATVHAFPRRDPRPATHMAESADPAVLAAISQPDTGAVVWQRPRPEALAAWLDPLAAESLPVLWTTTRPDQVAAQVIEACGNDGAGPQALAADVAGLAGRMAEISGQSLLSVRLKLVTTDSCRRFHVDAMRCRMLCSYRGAGTQYGVAPPGGGDPDPIHQLLPGAVMLMRGADWPTAQRTGILHRSPPMSPGAMARLLLVIDPADDPSLQV